ncbi:MAG: D-alanyl-D-alanine carboxypeptidase family protein [Rickettsiella sp.]|nr:D-alanyl-D-alanine carboxypeptidase family protein [Rickettsiella sp.]
MLKMRSLLPIVIGLIASLLGSFGIADPIIPITAPAAGAAQQPTLTPIAPSVNAKAYLLMDAYSGNILASDNIDERVAPASLTKMMTSYVISMALKEGRIHADDLVTISETAWKTGGSKMFVKVGDKVAVRDLMQGIIVDSGNDACVAMAEYVAGSQESFVNLMNQAAAQLGMSHTHFVDVDGLPDPNHYSTTRDMAILARALILDFPEDYKWYSQKWFSYNGIKQPNRNRLLWRDADVDGIKTGHTNDAGYCLAASGEKKGMRLITIVMGAPSDEMRAQDSQKLLTYGFRFFESQKLYTANTKLASTRVWLGQRSQISVGIARDLYATFPAGQNKVSTTKMVFTPNLKAPLKKGEVVGKINITLNDKLIASAQLITLENLPRGGLWRNLVDHTSMWFHKAEA